MGKESTQPMCVPFVFMLGSNGYFFIASLHCSFTISYFFSSRHFL